MARKPRKQTTHGRTLLSREQLLPMAPTQAQTVSLQNHMALVALRQGRGNIELTGELLKTVYITYFCADTPMSDSSQQTFVVAELALRDTIVHSQKENEWRIDEQHCHSIEVVLRYHDAQLGSLPLHRIASAKARLTRILDKGKFPNLSGADRKESQE